MDKSLISVDNRWIMDDYVKLIILLMAVFIAILVVIQFILYLPGVIIITGITLITTWLTNEIKKLWNF